MMERPCQAGPQPSVSPEPSAAYVPSSSLHIQRVVPWRECAVLRVLMTQHMLEAEETSATVPSEVIIL